MRAVDVRPARPGAVVGTVIAGAGKESQIPPAEPGDIVVRNAGPATGKEEILVPAAKLAERYEGPIGPANAGWQTCRPRAIEMRHYVVRQPDGRFSFTAPWGEPMVARPGDAIVRDPCDPTDTFRIAAAALRVRCETPRPAS